MKAVWWAAKTAVTTAAWMVDCWVDRMVASKDETKAAASVASMVQRLADQKDVKMVARLGWSALMMAATLGALSAAKMAVSMVLPMVVKLVESTVS